MRTRRTTMATLVAALLIPFTVTPTLGAPPQPPVPSGERPLTEQERAASDRKVAAALAFVAGQDTTGGNLATLSCVTPRSTSERGAGGPSPEGCSVPQGFLTVYARDQTKGHYCGPAVGQVIGNYSWAVSSTGNKFTQAKIAEWMRTDINGGTGAPDMAAGLERGTVGSPRRPSGWAWVVTDVRDLNGSGSTGDELHTFVRSSVSSSKMPLAIPVKPHERSSDYNLSSWPTPVSSIGHWIAAYGWYSVWTGSDSARIYYTDSSEDEGGSTGKYWNSTRSLAKLIDEHTRRIVW